MDKEFYKKIQKEAKEFRQKKLREIFNKLKRGRATEVEKQILLDWRRKYGDRTY